MADDSETYYGSGSVSLFAAAVLGGLAYALTRWGPWGQATAQHGYAGVPETAAQADVSLFAIGTIWGFFLLAFGSYTSFQDKATQVNAVFTFWWSFAFFAGRWSQLTAATSLSQANIVPGQANATVPICTYQNIQNYALQDCQDLIGATVVLCFLWAGHLWYWTKSSLLGWVWDAPNGDVWFFYQNNSVRVLSCRAWRLFFGCESQGALEALAAYDGLAAQEWVNSYGFNIVVVFLWLLLQSVAQATQFYAVGTAGFYSGAQITFSDLSLAALVLGWACFLMSLFVVSLGGWGLLPDWCYRGAREVVPVFVARGMDDASARIKSWVSGERAGLRRRGQDGAVP